MADLDQSVSKLNEAAEKLAMFVEKSRIKEYVEMQKKPVRYFMMEFVGGISRGVGLTIGVTIIFAIIILVLTTILKQFITLPVIGDYIAQLIDLVNHSTKHIHR